MTELDLMQQLAAQRRQQYGQQAQFQAPQGQMVGRHFVAPNALQMLAAGLRSYGGIRGEQSAEQELKDIARQRTEGTQKALADFLRQSQGTPENAPGDGMGPVMPAQAPDMRGAYAALMQAPDAALRQAGMQGTMQIPQLEAAAAQRAEDMAFRQQQTEAERQFRMDQLRSQQEARMAEIQARNASAAEQAEMQRQFQREMAEMRRSMQPQQQGYFQFIGTPQGIAVGNARTGELSLGTINGQNVVRASDDPNLQGQISAARAGSSEAAKRVTESGLEAPQSIQQAQNSLNLLDDLLKHPGFKSSVGAERILPLRLIPGTPQADFESRLGQIQGQSFLQAFESLKGGGQITEIEGKKATEAINRMSASTSEREFRTAVSDLQEVLRQGISRAERAQQRLQNNPPAGVDLSPRPGNVPAQPRVLRFDAQGNIIQ